MNITLTLKYENISNREYIQYMNRDEHETYVKQKGESEHEDSVWGNELIGWLID